MNGVRVATIRKNVRGSIAVRIAEMRGRPMVDLRVVTPDREGREAFTPKGVAVRPDLVRSLIEALVEAEGEAHCLGLLGDDAG